MIYFLLYHKYSCYKWFVKKVLEDYMFKLIKFAFVLFLGVISCACVNMVAVYELNQKASEYLYEGDVDSAISRLEASIDLDGNVYESRYNLASAYLRVGKNEKAYENSSIAVTLTKNEPIAFYTHAIACMKVANDLFETKDENGQIVPASFRTSSDEKKAAKRYVELLRESNIAYDKYVQLAPNAEDTQSIFAIMKDNEQKISAKISQYNLNAIEWNL